MMTFLTKARQILRQGGTGALLDRGRRFIDKIVDQYWQRRAALPIGAFRYDTTRPLCLILDHDSGGGTQAYREWRVARYLEAGNDVLVWQYLVHFRSWLLDLRTPSGSTLYTASTLVEVFDVVGEARPCAILINNLVGWFNLSAVFDGLRRLQKAGAHLECFLHDYFAVCPVYVLLNPTGKFCGIPDNPAVCIECLPGHPLAPPGSLDDLYTWRARWGAMLHDVDSLNAADGTVRDLYARVYPQAAQCICIHPHPPLAQWQPLALPGPDQPGVIAIIGTITRHKGAGLVEMLTRLLETGNYNMRVVVIGTLESSLQSPLLTVHGPYAHASLPVLLTQHGVTVCLVPSICPETFCYAAQEAEMLGFPLVCLDRGAQGARARHYARGRVASTADAAGCLAAICELESLRMA